MIETSSHKLAVHNYSKLLHAIVYPCLFGLLMNLPWLNQVLIALTFSFATLMVGNFVDALIALWQALAYSGLFLLIISLIRDTGIKQFVAASVVLVIWFAILTFKRCHLYLKHELKANNIFVEMTVLVILIFSWFKVPRDLRQSFGFLSAEDNAGWVKVVSDIASVDGLSLRSGFDLASVQYFVKVVLNFLIHLGTNGAPLSGEIGARALGVISNAWVFVFVSSLFFVLRVSSELLNHVRTSFNSVLIISAVGLQSVLYFRASQYVGHFSQYLTNCVILIFMIQIIDLKLENRLILKVFVGISSLIFSVAVVGSYNPWMPVSIICVALVFNSFFGDPITRKIFKGRFILPTFLFVLVISPLIWRAGSSRASGLDDGGAVHQIPQEGVIVLLGISSLILFRIFWDRLTNYFEKSSKSQNRKYDWIQATIYMSLSALVAGVLLKIELNQFITLCLICIVALLFTRNGATSVYENFKIFGKNSELDSVFLLGFASFAYALVVYFMSRYIGPVFEPRYAANKSMFMVFGQFSWLILILLGVNQSLSKNFDRIFRTLVVIACFFVISGITPYFSRDPFQPKWWQQPVIKALDDDPNAVIVCINPDWRSVDYEVYTCNRFLQTLTKFEYPASGFRYLAWYQPDEFVKISDWFAGKSKRAREFNSETRVIVISQAELSAETRTIFSSVDSNMIEYRT
jgi:hypothetical protein